MEMPVWIELKRGLVKEILENDGSGTAVVRLDIAHPCKLAVAYIPLTGPVEVGDEVLANTTACSRAWVRGATTLLCATSAGRITLLSAGVMA